MPIVKCPKCRKRYDPGTEDLDDLPDNMSVKVVCPACGQWARLPECEAIAAPKLPPAMVKSMKSKARLVDDDEADDRPAKASSPVITCPECKKKFKGKGDLRGKKIRCPFCSAPFQVPAGDTDDDAESARTMTKPASKKAAKDGKPAAPARPPAAPAKAPTPAADADDEFDNPNPYGVTTQDLVPRCPNCANEMESEAAVICLFCGYNTQLRTWGKTEKVIAQTGGEHFMYLLPGLAVAVFIILQIASVIFYCLVLPTLSKDTFMAFTDHESMRMWTVIITLGDLWPLGMFAVNRLVLNPKPPDKIKD